MSEFDADLIVVGLGAMGAATTYHAAKAGLRVIGLDQYEPPHNLGSTHAETRITRLAVGEGPQYLPFVARAHEVWRQLEAAAGEQLLYETGGLILTRQDAVPGQRWEDFTAVTKAIADSAGIPFSIEEPAEIRHRFPMYNVPDDMRVGYEPSAGVVMAERAVTLQLTEAKRLGAKLLTNTRVTNIRHDASGVDVSTATPDGTAVLRASHVVLAAGPWIHELAPTVMTDDIEVTRQVVYWFEAEDLQQFSVEQFPFSMWVDQLDEEYVGVFPSPPGARPGLKAVSEQFLEPTNPDSVERTVSQQEIDEFYQQLLRPKLEGVSPTCIRAEVCLYTSTADDHFLIDVHPESERVVVMSPCSGHGFKHSTALGEAVAQKIATGASDLDLAPFALSERTTR